MERFFGCHVSAAQGLENAVLNADEIGVNTIQIHPSAPQRWVTKEFAPGLEDKFLELKAKSGLKKIFFHGIYLINLANPDKQKFHLSKLSLVHYLDLASRMGADGVIFHLGSNSQQPSDDDGFRQAAEGINWIFEQSKNKARLLLEVAAGSGKVIGDRVEELSTVYEGVADKDRVGFALDTQHMWASGYDLKKDLNGIVDTVDNVLGLNKVWAIHLNDSKTELGSKKDRHENLGQGLIGEQALERVINHSKLKNIPFILETPDLESIEGAKKEVSKLRELIKPA